MTYTVDQIADMAERACFYKAPNGLWLRILYCNMEEGNFQCVNDDSGEEYNITFDEVVQTNGDGEFHELVKMTEC